jgi:hypothetical protein
MTKPNWHRVVVVFTGARHSNTLKFLFTYGSLFSGQSIEKSGGHEILLQVNAPKSLPVFASKQCDFDVAMSSPDRCSQQDRIRRGPAFYSRKSRCRQENLEILSLE